MVVGLAVPNVAQAATPPPTAAVVPAADPVPEQYIVTLEGGTAKAAVPGEAEQLADRYDAGVLDVYDTALVGFSARMSPDDAQRLAADPHVALVEQDGYVQASATEPTPGGLWGLDRIDQRDLPVNGSYTYSTTAANVHAYVLDTGLYLSHSDFAGRVEPGPRLRRRRTPRRLQRPRDPRHGHARGNDVRRRQRGAHRPGTRARLHGQGTFSNVIAGVNWVTQNAIHPAVANMSLGGTRSQTLNNAIDASINSGVTYTVAAGNNRVDACLSSPGDDGRAIVVGASTQADARAEFSNWGPCVDIFAPGDRILSDFLGGGTATFSGTSMAAPHVAGAAALYLAGHPTASADEVVGAVACTTTIGHVSDTVGSLNVLLYMGDLTATAPLLPCTPVPDPPVSGIGTVHLSWQTAVGAVPIEQFEIYRGTASGAETLLTGHSRDHVELRRPHRRGGDLVLPDQGFRPERFSDLSTRSWERRPLPRWTPRRSRSRCTSRGRSRPTPGPRSAASTCSRATHPIPHRSSRPCRRPRRRSTSNCPGRRRTRFFVVKAVKRPGAPVATPSNEVAVTPLPGAPPGAPVLAASARNNRASLSWMAPPSNDGTGAIGSYKVLRGTTAGGETPIATVAGTQTSYSDPGPLVNGTAYYYKVVASTTTFGDGSASNEQVVVPSAVDVAFLTPSASVELRRVDGDVPGPTLALGGAGTSNPSVVSNANGTFVFVRGGDNRLYWQRVLNGIPMGWNPIGERSRPTRSRWPTARTSRSSSAAATTVCTDS